MRSIRLFSAVAAVAALLAGCVHNGTQSVAGGDVTVDSLTATRTAILRVQNNYPSEVRIYTVVAGQPNYVTKAMPGEVRTEVLDPKLFPITSISFEARPADGAATQTVGPFAVRKGETVEFVVPALLQNAHATVHKSIP